MTNVVFMGMGEPFHNYDAVMDRRRAAQRPARIRARPPAHHHFNGRHRAGYSAVRERGHPGQPGHLAARTDRRGALGDHAGHKVAGRRADGRRRAVYREDQPQGVLRVRHARRRQRPAAGRRGARHGPTARPLYHVNIIPYNTTPDAKLGATGDQRIRAFSAILEAKVSPVRCVFRWVATSQPRAASSAPKRNRAPTRV